MKIVPILGLAMVIGFSARAEDDQDRVRRAVEAGRILPLRELLDRVEPAIPGQLIEAELESENGTPIYELILVSPEGKVVKLRFDARTGDPVAAPGRSHRH